MIKRILCATSAAFLLIVAPGFSEETYKKPPQAVLDVLNAPLPPDAVVSPSKDFVILTVPQRYPPIADVAAPMLRLAGERINPATNGPHRAQYVVSITLKKMADGRQLRVMYDMRTSPPGLMPWLIVRTHRFAANRLHWRRGTSLLHRERTALLTLDAQDRRLELIVSLGVFTIHLPQLRERGEDRDVPPVCQPAARSGVAAILRSRSLVCVGSRAILMVWVGHEAQDQLEFPAMRYASRARKRHLAATCHFPRVFQGFRG